MPSGYNTSYKIVSINHFKTYSLTTWEFNYSNTCFLNLLNSTIWEYTFLLSIWEKAFNCTIREGYLLGTILEMFLYLIVCKFKYLKTIRESCLSGFCLCEIIHNFLIWECLFDITISEVNNRVTTRPHLSSNTIAKHNFLLSIVKEFLLFAIMGSYFLYQG